MRIQSIALCLLGLLSISLSNAFADNWGSWRGPNNAGISSEKKIPSSWSKTDNVLWRVDLPGPAGSTPAVWEDRIFLTSVDNGDMVLICLDTSGKQLWKNVLGTGNKDVRGDEGNSASPSPSTDGKHVWVFFTDGSLGCFDFSGKQVWKFDVEDRYGAFKIQFGMTSTPVLDGDNLYLQLIHSGGAKVVALEKSTGKQVWVHKRKSDAYAECEHSYASPMMYNDGKLKFLISHGADYTVAHDLNDGHELWRVGGLHPLAGYDPTLRFVASPLAVPGMIVIPSAKKGSLVSVKPNGNGDITDKEDHYHWTYATTPDVPSPLAVGDYVYLCRENGNLICLNKATGEKLYENRTNPTRHRASPVFADDKIYLTGRNGKVTVVKPGPEFEIIAQNDIEESLSASPAISNGVIYLRSFDALWAIGKK
ncbi:MAG: outer membrane protein assembly factor BamB family protein [Pirellulales bacterium]